MKVFSSTIEETEEEVEGGGEDGKEEKPNEISDNVNEDTKTEESKKGCEKGEEVNQMPDSRNENTSLKEERRHVSEKEQEINGTCDKDRGAKQDDGKQGTGVKKLEGKLEVTRNEREVEDGDRKELEDKISDDMERNAAKSKANVEVKEMGMVNLKESLPCSTNKPTEVDHDKINEQTNTYKLTKKSSTLK